MRDRLEDGFESGLTFDSTSLVKTDVISFNSEGDNDSQCDHT
jgi:hypothetical protein